MAGARSRLDVAVVNDLLDVLVARFFVFALERVLHFLVGARLEKTK
jgi:hypothetical protein